MIAGSVVRSSVLVGLVAGCASGLTGPIPPPPPPPPSPQPWQYQAPPNLGDGLGGAAATARGVDTARISSLVRSINSGATPNIHAVLIYRGGDLVLEEYFAGTMRWDNRFRIFGRDSLHDIYSVSKSITGAAIGMSIAAGTIASVDAKVAPTFQDYVAQTTTDLSAMTVRHLLTMSAGLAWDELSTDYTDPANSNRLMDQSPDPLAYLVTRPRAAAPGSRFAYNTGLTHWLGEYVKRRNNQSLDQYVDARLFNALGIDRFFWYRFPTGLIHAGGGLHLRPRDMMKFGVLYRNFGRWQGSRVVDSTWVVQSTTRQAPGAAYGFQWWIDSWTVNGRTVSGYSAQGFAGQFIFVIPALDVVVVFTGNNAGQTQFLPIQLVQNIILPALN